MLNLTGKTWDPNILVITPASDTRHPMWQKMWERAGFDPATVKVLPLENWPKNLLPGQRPIPESVHTVIPMGELALQTVVGVNDLFRWRGRVSVIYNWGLPVVALATLRVTEMLPRINSVTMGSQLSNRPARFQGVWIRDVQQAEKNGGQFVRHNDKYLLDPKNLNEWDSWVRDALTPGRQLSFDIETQYTPKGQKSEEEDTDKAPEGAILRCSFSITPHTGTSIP